MLIVISVEMEAVWGWWPIFGPAPGESWAAGIGLHTRLAEMGRARVNPMFYCSVVAAGIIYIPHLWSSFAFDGFDGMVELNKNINSNSNIIW